MMLQMTGFHSGIDGKEILKALALGINAGRRRQS